MLVRQAFDGHDIRFATTYRAVAERDSVEGVIVLPDCNVNTPLAALKCAFAAAWLVANLRPDIVVSTGAAPGFFCLFWGRILGARILWIDSIANGEELSLCGKFSRYLAHECLTQWEHLSHDPALKFRGGVL
ncbi:MAG: glucuronosyltransferase [Pseudomonadota bacterium]